MRLLAAARRAMTSTRAPPSPLAANSTIAACRISSRVRSGIRCLRTPGGLTELRPRDGDDPLRIVERLASTMDHPNERELRGKAGPRDGLDDRPMRVAEIDADAACDVGEGNRQKSDGSGVIIRDQRTDLG